MKLLDDIKTNLPARLKEQLSAAGYADVGIGVIPHPTTVYYDTGEALSPETAQRLLLEEQYFTRQVERDITFLKDAKQRVAKAEQRALFRASLELIGRLARVRRLLRRHYNPSFTRPTVSHESAIEIGSAHFERTYRIGAWLVQNDKTQSSAFGDKKGAFFGEIQSELGIGPSTARNALIEMECFAEATAKGRQEGLQETIDETIDFYWRYKDEVDGA